MAGSRSFLTTLFTLFLCSSVVSSASTPLKAKRRPLVKLSSTLARRDGASIDSPSRGYAPVRTACPADLSVRQVPITGELSQSETTYLEGHAAATVPAWRDYLENVALADFDIDAFLSTGDLPVTSIAASGGGFRAMLFGGGILNGLDSRNASAVTAKTGGVLDVTTYLAGLSGGSWLVGSWALANAPTFQELNSTVWMLNTPFVEQTPNTRTDALNSTAVKQDAGYNVSFVDEWGRLLSYFLIEPPLSPDSYPGIDTLWSAIRETEPFLSQTLPFPLITAVGKPDSDSVTSLTNPTYEISAYELGIRHPSLNAFVDIDYLGTNLVDGKPVAGAQCTKGFDNAGFLLGTSSDLFLVEPQSADALIEFVGEGKTLQQLFPKDTPEQALSARYPSPFEGLNPSTYRESAQSELLLADGASTGENIPFQPLIVPERKVDVILALDASADTPDNRPNGSSIYTTYQRTRLPGGYDFVDFPEVPKPGDAAYEKITWFGCDSPQTIIYVPNVAMANNETGTTAFQPQYSNEAVEAFFDNSFDIITQPETKGEWPVCLACALVDKQIKRNGGQRTEQCQRCFSEYCYGGAGPTPPCSDDPSPPSPGPSQHHHTPHGAQQLGPSQRAAKKRANEQHMLSAPLLSKPVSCPDGQSACPISESGWECVDLASELNSCGKCGFDCEMMPGVTSVGVRCSAGKCQATACQPGWRLDRNDCIKYT